MGSMLIHVPLVPLGGWSFNVSALACYLFLFVWQEASCVFNASMKQKHKTGPGVVLCPRGKTLTQRGPFFSSSSKHLCTKYHDTLQNVALNEHVDVSFSLTMLSENNPSSVGSSHSFLHCSLSCDRLNELPYSIIQGSKGQIMSNSLNLVSKSITALKALLHWQFYAAAMKVLSGQQQRSVTMLGSFDQPTIKTEKSQILGGSCG